MKNKQSRYKDRYQAWQTALATADEHIKTGTALRSQGAIIMNKIRQATDIEPGEFAKLIAQATGIIQTGIKAERDAHNEKLRLMDNEPSDGY